MHKRLPGFREKSQNYLHPTIQDTQSPPTGADYLRQSACQTGNLENGMRLEIGMPTVSARTASQPGSKMGKRGSKATPFPQGPKWKRADRKPPFSSATRNTTLLRRAQGLAADCYLPITRNRPGASHRGFSRRS